MNQQELKKAAAKAALEYCLSHLKSDSILGIGTGSTVNLFIEALGAHRNKFAACVSSSERSSERLRNQGIEVLDLNDVSGAEIYVDGADEINQHLEMIKGGGAALTREKIVAAASNRFVCIADDSKWVQSLGQFPVPIEVIPLARAQVQRQLENLDGRAVLREGVVTDNGNQILDVHGWKIQHARELEEQLNQIVGVVTNGIFAHRPADVLFLAKDSGVDYVVRT